MGIQGLLPALKDIILVKKSSDFSGKVLAVDGYCWLHRGIYTCAEQLCQGIETEKYVNYFMNRVFALKENGIIPYIVFDGGHLPAKESIERERKSKRDRYKAEGLAHLKQKRQGDAWQCFTKAVDVTPEMASRVIRQLKKYSISYLVAPYEADAQISYLCREGIVDGVITEDSDCIPYGCKLILFKMTAKGEVQEFEASRLSKSKILNFRGFTDEMVLDMCILAGCDYLASIPGMGVKKAHALVKKYGSTTKLFRAIRYEGKMKIPMDYEKKYNLAKFTFLHQRIYDPRTETITFLTPFEPTSSSFPDEPLNLDFLGPMITSENAKSIANGDIDPFSMLPFNFKVEIVSISAPSVQTNLSQNQVVSHRSISNKSKPEGNKRPTNLLTNYFNKKIKEDKEDINVLLKENSKNLCNGIKEKTEIIHRSLALAHVTAEKKDPFMQFRFVKGSKRS